MRNSRAVCLSAILLVLPLLAACTGSPNLSDTSSSQCVLSSAEASKAFGSKLKVSEASGSCRYTGRGVVFHTTVNRRAGSDGWNTEVSDLTQSDSAATTVPGVGDEAIGDGFQIDTLLVRKGDAVIQVKGAEGADSTSQDLTHSIAIARAILAKLN